ncbi:MAG: RdgB/HAM1 family non-canonical purine NTP pyrophosphatase [Anaerolineae bacterium]|jgi:non-canonical purine NTP pyrophosphatase (RdgB/HAM1 family)|nr:RdgB/HAM1 family non-canonical purine NTP pyrophosphatase [Anaerolineae bacterium]
MFNVIVIGPVDLNWEEITQSLPKDAEPISLTSVLKLSDLPSFPKHPEHELIIFDAAVGLDELKVCVAKKEKLPVIYYSSSLDDAMTAMEIGIDDFVVPSDFASGEKLFSLVLQKWIRRKKMNLEIASNRHRQQASDFQRIIASITNSLINSMSIDEIDPKDVKEILRQVGEVLDVDMASIGFLKDGLFQWENYLAWHRDSMDSTEDLAAYEHVKSDSVENLRSIQILKETEEPIIFSTRDEFPQDALLELQELQTYDIQAGMTWPLMVSGEFYGFFRCSMKGKTREWQEEEIEFARVCAEIFTAVMLRWRNIAQLESSVYALRKRNLEITAINQMGIRLQRSRNLSQIFSVVEHFSKELFPGSVGMLHLCSKNEQPSTVSQWGEWPFELLVEVEQVVSAIEDQGGKAVNDAAVSTMCESITDQIKNINGDIRPACIPLKVQNEIIGMLSLFFLHGQHITATMRSLILNFAERIGLAVANLQLREDLHFHSIRDPLTGLYNRRFMEHVFENEMRRTMRRHHPLSVMIMDVDHFKSVNDALGHEVGDQMLKAIAHYLSSRMRKEDVICRYGGDEFVIILPETLVEDAENRANDLRIHVSEAQDDPLVRQFNITGLSLSIGVACYPVHGTEPSDLLRAADHALYYSKNHGRDQVRIAPKEITSQLRSPTRRNLSVTDWLKEIPAATTEFLNRTDRVPLVVATNNLGKLREIQEIMTDSGLEFALELFRPHDLGINLEVEETGNTYAENASLKVKAFRDAVKLQFPRFIIIADDSGLEVDALDGKPGIRSSRYAPIPNANDADRRRYLLSSLRNKAQPWNASFHCTIALMTSLTENVEYFSGSCRGQIIAEERGNSGFGYDPVFLLLDLGKTMAELLPEEKNSLSHRGNALRNAFPRMKELYEQILK